MSSLFYYLSSVHLFINITTKDKYFTNNFIIDPEFISIFQLKYIPYLKASLTKIGRIYMS